MLSRIARETANLPVLALALISVYFLMALAALAPAQTEAQPLRAVTIADVIGMTEMAESDHSNGDLLTVAQSSPDGKTIIAVVRKGNLERNTNDFSLLRWRTAEIFKLSQPEVLLTMSSSSNRSAIEKLSWIDNETVAFLGENPNETHEVYTFNLRKRKLKRMTQHPTNVTAYSIAEDGNTIAYSAGQPISSIFDERSRKQGLSITTQWLNRLIEGVDGGDFPWGKDELFAQRSNRTTPLTVLGRPAIYWPTFALSPNGRYLAILTQVSNVQESWREYADPGLQHILPNKIKPGAYTWIYHYELIDTSTGKSRVLLDAPGGQSPPGSELAWSPSSDAVAITNTFLPLTGTTEEELARRRASPFAVEIKIETGEITKISNEKLTLRHWEKNGDLVFADGRSDDESQLLPEVTFRKIAGVWQKIATMAGQTTKLEIRLQQDMDSPPRIVALDHAAHRQAVLLDLNPQLKNLRFGKVEAISWRTSDGREVSGGLYYPVDFHPGTRYPLVIQTHGWNPHLFWIDGPWPTGYAAQPLVGKNIMVLQIEMNMGKTRGTAEESPLQLANFLSAIDYLDRKGLIDRDKVGIMGFSRSCLHVTYALTHSSFHWAAAAITDGVDVGYLQYISFVNSSPGSLQLSERMNEGIPFAKEGAAKWLERSSAFNLDKVNAPVRITALENSGGLLSEWEWFAGLTRLGKPVDMVYIEAGEHILQLPWQRLISQQGSVDWFAFWLKGEEDPNPAKAEQYKKWRELRMLQSKVSD